MSANRNGRAFRSLSVFPFLLADEQNFVLADFGEAGADGCVVAESSVAVEFDKLVEHQRTDNRSSWADRDGARLQQFARDRDWQKLFSSDRWLRGADGGLPRAARRFYRLSVRAQ